MLKKLDFNENNYYYNNDIESIECNKSFNENYDYSWSYLSNIPFNYIDSSILKRNTARNNKLKRKR